MRLDRGTVGLPQNVDVVGEHVLWEDWADLVRLAHADPTTTASLFRRVDPGDLKGFRTDGVEMVWMEGYDRQPDGAYARLELWASPYARDPSALAPHLVRTMGQRGVPIYGDGWYLMLRSDPRRLEIVDTADGSLREWAQATEHYASENELLLSARGGLVRLDPHALPIVEE